MLNPETHRVLDSGAITHQDENGNVHYGLADNCPECQALASALNPNERAHQFRRDRYAELTDNNTRDLPW